ncbi:hypothetical protein PHYPSEUDO_001644 [Phytophthora pseudosyringae]|uniref:Uncharacterized protein n=1 Tax=Phytophthora pseudosyringae TaxID=221518 RepID=A0A8T1V5H8_9STRA|nr:hypothetical protein PHYPSEUDO_001644 [Phytophthora pseudosyringae]
MMVAHEGGFCRLRVSEMLSSSAMKVSLMGCCAGYCKSNDSVSLLRATIPSFAVCVAFTAVSLYISFLRSWLTKVLLEVAPLFEFFLRASVDAYVD